MKEKRGFLALTACWAPPLQPCLAPQPQPGLPAFGAWAQDEENRLQGQHCFQACLSFPRPPSPPWLFKELGLMPTKGAVMQTLAAA